MTKENHLEPPRKIDRAGTSWSTLNEIFRREELEINGTPRRSSGEEGSPRRFDASTFLRSSWVEDLESKFGGEGKLVTEREGTVSERGREGVT